VDLRRAGTVFENLGYAATSSTYMSLVQLTGLSNITQVAGGSSFNYALASNGTLYGWGGLVPTWATMSPRLRYASANAGSTDQYYEYASASDQSIVVNSECTHAILSDGSLWGGATMPRGDRNRYGAELYDDYYSYSWNFGNGDLLQQLPVQIVPSRSDFVALFGAAPLLSILMPRHPTERCIPGPE